MATETLTVGSMFSGIGLLEQGLRTGFRRQGIELEVIWQVEIDRACHPVLRRHFPNAKLYEDVNDERLETLPKTDIIAFGFPCQDISIAGQGAGLSGERSGLFFRAWQVSMLVEPKYIIMENVAALLGRGLDQVAATVAESGYNLEWTTLSAADCGAPHRRKRWWGVAYPRE